jgi:hypothetical protein
MKISMDKKYKSNGKSIRILCTDRPDYIYPIVAMDDNGIIHYFMKDGIALSGPKYNLEEIWEPNKHEWCLFWDRDERESAILQRFYKMLPNGKFQSYRHICGEKAFVSWDYCERFDGTLPQHLARLK